MDKLAIIVPCYNEEEVLNMTISALSEKISGLIEKKLISTDSKIVFVNDGSRDATWNIIEESAKNNPCVAGVNLAGNVGHQSALMAGLEYSVDKFDVNISIDADLQDDINAIDDMVRKYLDGADIVYGVRNDRTSDSFFKRFTAESFYKVMQFMGVKTVYNHADFRLMSARATKALLAHSERNLYLRGIVPTLGFKTESTYYSRHERTAGTSKYPLKKMLALAWEGITSFTIKPMTVILSTGAIISCVSALVTLLVVIASLVKGGSITTQLLIGSIWFLGGVQLLSVGIIGQYIGKIYVECKRRPRYNIQEVIDNEKTL